MVEWMYSHVATAVDDLGAMILESVTRNSPAALTSLRLDVSQLKDRGLAHMKKALGQSNLEQLSVECEAFDLSWSSLVGQVLGAVRCPLVDLSLENIQLQDNQDWDLVIDAIGFSQLVVLGMFKSNFQDVRMLLEKLGEQRTPLEELDLRHTPADEELRKKFRHN
ncbi:hypothetical protein BG005_002425 [Podila minutissima]|nr:hypothetical protein BG005_002425 [Podila minutissima]